MNWRLLTVSGIAATAGLLWLGLATAQEGDARLEGEPTAEFHFARLYYTQGMGGRGRGWGRGWRTDYPDAEYHLMQGVTRLTRVDGASVDYYGEGGRIISLDDERVFVSASIGITLYPEDGEGMLDLIKNADQAMYAAKQQGRNCYRYFTQDMQQNAIKRMKMIGERASRRILGGEGATLGRRY